MQNIKSLFLQHVGQTSDQPYGLIVKRAKGIYIFDENDKAHIDLISGIGPAILGHSHPRIVEAGKSQMNKYMHTMVYGEHVQEPQVRYAKYLAGLLPDPLESTYFVNSGTEAVEAAMKLSKKATGRYEIIACENAYHGSTQGASALMSNDRFFHVHSVHMFRAFVLSAMTIWKALKTSVPAQLLFLSRPCKAKQGVKSLPRNG